MHSIAVQVILKILHDGNIGLESSDEDICILEDTIEDSFQIEDEKITNEQSFSQRGVLIKCNDAPCFK